MSAQKKPQLNTELLRTRLKLKAYSTERKLLESHSVAKKFFETYKLRPGQIRNHAVKLLTSGALASGLLLSNNSIIPSIIPLKERIIHSISSQTVENNMTGRIWPVLPDKIGPLTPEQESRISKIIKDLYNVQAVAELEGNRLNQTYGRMGAEQHLPRYPGDTVYNHKEFAEKGITPGLGAWGYFAYSPNELTPELEQIEKYYVAVQTLYLPDWVTRLNYLRDWYKYRRVVVINPENGKAIIAAVADSGPAWWTGKTFGGSPEVMAYLKINVGMQNSPVILFFVDEKNKKVPLGPLEYNDNKDKITFASEKN